MVFTGLLYKMSNYLSGIITLDTFEEWFVSCLPYLYSPKIERKTQVIVDEIELSFAQLNDSIIDEEEFKKSMMQAFENVSYFKIFDYNCKMEIPYNNETESLTDVQKLTFVLPANCAACGSNEGFSSAWAHVEDTTYRNRMCLACVKCGQKIAIAPDRVKVNPRKLNPGEKVCILIYAEAKREE